jgi:hypothetical protein
MNEALNHMNEVFRQMNLDIFSSFHDIANANGILFYYHGNISQNVISTMGEALKHRLESQDANARTSRKVFSSFIEMVQNTMHYSDEPDAAGSRLGTVAVGKRDERFFIVSGNLIDKQFAARIRERLEPLRQMSAEEIKRAYHEQLKSDNSDDSISKGAGLGFLTLARDAAEPIEYSLVDMPGHESEYSYFYLKAVI